MMRTFSGLVVLLVLAVAFGVGLLVTRNQTPPIEDPLGDAVKQISEVLGMDLSTDTEGELGAGVEVLAVKPDSPADLFGIQKGDLIRAVGDRSVWHAKDIADQISANKAMGSFSFLVQRNGVFHQVVFGQPGSAGPGSNHAH